jgi:hypothetical protein
MVGHDRDLVYYLIVYCVGAVGGFRLKLASLSSQYATVPLSRSSAPRLAVLHGGFAAESWERESRDTGDCPCRGRVVIRAFI